MSTLATAQSAEALKTQPSSQLEVRLSSNAATSVGTPARLRTLASDMESSGGQLLGGPSSDRSLSDTGAPTFAGRRPASILRLWSTHHSCNEGTCQWLHQGLLYSVQRHDCLEVGSKGARPLHGSHLIQRSHKLRDTSLSVANSNCIYDAGTQMSDATLVARLGNEELPGTPAQVGGAQAAERQAAGAQASTSDREQVSHQTSSTLCSHEHICWFSFVSLRWICLLFIMGYHPQRDKFIV